MATWEPIDITHFYHDDIEDVYSNWGDNLKNDLEVRFNKLRKFNETLNESTDEDTIEMTEKTKDAFKRGTIELIANQIYDRLTLSFDNTRKRLGIQKGEPIAKPIRKLKKLDENLDERSKAIESSSTTDAEAIKMIKVTSKDIDATVKDVEQDTSFIEPGERDNLLPLRELEGLDKQLRTIKGSLKVAIAKCVDLEGHIKLEERKLSEVQDPKYSDDQRDMIEDRIGKLRGELTERNKEIDILKGEASKQINQMRESITKFLDKETGTLGERIRTLFKEQGITIVSILTAVGMAIGFLIEALLGGPSTSGGTSGGDEEGGAREWIKNKLKALSQLLGKLADKALASLPGIIGSIISWILNRAEEVVGWLSQNLWALITGVGVLIYTYFMTKTRRG